MTRVDIGRPAGKLNPPPFAKLFLRKEQPAPDVPTSRSFREQLSCDGQPQMADLHLGDRHSGAASSRPGRYPTGPTAGSSWPAVRIAGAVEVGLAARDEARHRHVRDLDGARLLR
jgi:hypothetical protein